MSEHSEPRRQTSAWGQFTTCQEDVHWPLPTQHPPHLLVVVTVWEVYGQSCIVLQLCGQFTPVLAFIHIFVIFSANLDRLCETRKHAQCFACSREQQYSKKRNEASH